MADSININVDNERFNRSLEEYIDNNLEKGIRRGMERACMLVEGTAKELCKFDTGHLSASITHEIEQKGSIISGFVGTNVEYAPFVHEGTGIYASNGMGRTTPWMYEKDGKFYRTVGQEPNPFLADSIKKHRKDIVKIIKDNY